VSDEAAPPESPPEAEAEAEDTPPAPLPEELERPARTLREATVRIDSEPRLLSMARNLRRRLPGDERFGDPLSTAGDRPVEVVGRRVSALQPDRPSVAHELGLGALQVWQSLSESAGRGRGTREVALLFTDLVDFSSWALKAGDEATLELLREVGTAIETAVTACDGTIVKRLGDGVMAAFRHPQDAVDAAFEALARLEGVEVAGYQPRMRAGVHHGKPRRIGGDYLGVDVNIAARVGEAAKGGQVLVSEPAFDMLDPQRVTGGRSKALRASGAPKGLRVRAVQPVT
jgi:class 3 adenylate cyclase